MTTKENLRPDPLKGVEAGYDYGAAYAVTHSDENNTLDYRFGYAWLLMLDQLLVKGYSLLDVGCGTGAYHRLLRNYGRIVGLDFSKEMIGLANDFKARNNLVKIDYIASRFENYASDSQFDIVNLAGTFGWYIPWPGQIDVLARVAQLLKQDGVACFTYVPPRSKFGLLKSLMFPEKTVVLRPTAFNEMLKKSGFSTQLELRYPHVTIIIAKKCA